MGNPKRLIFNGAAEIIPLPGFWSTVPFAPSNQGWVCQDYRFIWPRREDDVVFSDLNCAASYPSVCWQDIALLESLKVVLGKTSMFGDTPEPVLVPFVLRARLVVLPRPLPLSGSYQQVEVSAIAPQRRVVPDIRLADFSLNRGHCAETILSRFFLLTFRKREENDYISAFKGIPHRLAADTPSKIPAVRSPREKCGVVAGNVIRPLASFNRFAQGAPRFAAGTLSVAAE